MDKIMQKIAGRMSELLDEDETFALDLEYTLTLALDDHNAIVARWIPVTEQLPPMQWYDGERKTFSYLVPVFASGDVAVARYNHASGHWISDHGYILKSVTHWSRLPDTPREVGG